MKKYRSVSGGVDFRNSEKYLITLPCDFLLFTEGRLVSEMVDSSSRLSDLFASALSEASENYGRTAGKKASGADNKKTTGESKRFSGRYDYSKSFAEQIDDYNAGIFPHRDTLVVCRTPKVLRKVGLNDLPMTYSIGHLQTIIDGDVENHKFGVDLLKHLPEALEDPLAVIASKTQSETSLVVIFDYQYAGDNLIGAVAVDGFGLANGERIDSNAVTTVYSREDAISGLLKEAILEEQSGKIGVFYLKKSEAANLQQRAGVQFPRWLFRNNGFIHSIRDEKSPVNPKFQSFTESLQFKRFFGEWRDNPARASKVVDGKGIPKIASFYMNGDFSVLDSDQMGRNGGLGHFGKGFYFTTKSDFRSPEMKVFLNVRNPLIIDELSDRKRQDLYDYAINLAEKNGNENIRLNSNGEKVFYNPDSHEEYGYRNFRADELRQGHFSDVLSEGITQWARKNGYLPI